MNFTRNPWVTRVEKERERERSRRWPATLIVRSPDEIRSISHFCEKGEFSQWNGTEWKFDITGRTIREDKKPSTIRLGIQLKETKRGKGWGGGNRVNYRAGIVAWSRALFSPLLVLWNSCHKFPSDKLIGFGWPLHLRISVTPFSRGEKRAVDLWYEP